MKAGTEIVESMFVSERDFNVFFFFCFSFFGYSLSKRIFVVWSIITDFFFSTSILISSEWKIYYLNDLFKDRIVFD